MFVIIFKELMKWWMAGYSCSWRNIENIFLLKHLITKDRQTSTLWLKNMFCLLIVSVNLIIRRIFKLVPIWYNTSIYITYNLYNLCISGTISGSHSKFLVIFSLYLNKTMTHDKIIEHVSAKKCKILNLLKRYIGYIIDNFFVY